jgi:hypothetical protein
LPDWDVPDPELDSDWTAPDALAGECSRNQEMGRTPPTARTAWPRHHEVPSRKSPSTVSGAARSALEDAHAARSVDGCIDANTFGSAAASRASPDLRDGVASTTPIDSEL